MLHIRQLDTSKPLHRVNDARAIASNPTPYGRTFDMTILCVYIFVVIGLPLLACELVCRVLDVIEGMNQ